jgi:zinc D-Ala-D-Ala carboxypeptidase
MPNIYSSDFQSKNNFKILSDSKGSNSSKRSKILFGLATIALLFSFIIFVNSLISFALFNNPNSPSVDSLDNPTLQSFDQIVTNTTSYTSSSSTINFEKNQTPLASEQIKNTNNLLSSSLSPIKTQSSSQNLASAQADQLEIVKEIVKVSINSIVTPLVPEKQTITLPVLSGSDFQNIYENTQYSNVSPAIAASITDNVAVDSYIRTLGESRGYKLRPQAVESSLVAVDGFLLQDEASNAWQNLKQSAANDGVRLVLTSGYRSIASQRSIFAADLAPEYQVEDILAGRVDGPLQGVMNRVSVPGYSRHHTGYTIDIGCSGEGSVFKNTSCYQWMKKDNFAQARIAGYIPSYPTGVATQGPNPEEWEFVWVGQK